MWPFASIGASVLIVLVGYSEHAHFKPLPAPLGNASRVAMIEARADVELDIYSGRANPMWWLTNAEAESLIKRLQTLPPTGAKDLQGQLGYRGFVVRLAYESMGQLIRVQAGTVHITQGEFNFHAVDGQRELERWLLHTGRSHLTPDVIQIVEREIR